ncbi:hypothetical protein ACOME3_008954 [Neoechinorhynchus agilis]
MSTVSTSSKLYFDGQQIKGSSPNEDEVKVFADEGDMDATVDQLMEDKLGLVEHSVNHIDDDDVEEQPKIEIPDNDSTHFDNNEIERSVNQSDIKVQFIENPRLRLPIFKWNSIQFPNPSSDPGPRMPIINETNAVRFFNADYIERQFGNTNTRNYVNLEVTPSCVPNQDCGAMAWAQINRDNQYGFQACSQDHSYFGRPTNDEASVAGAAARALAAVVLGQHVPNVRLYNHGYYNQQPIAPSSVYDNSLNMLMIGNNDRMHQRDSSSSYNRPWYLFDNSNNCSSSVESGATTAAATTAKRPHVKKPLNAFMLFMRENRPKVATDTALKESAAINQILGRKWHSLSKEEQAKYYEMARLERVRHMEQHPGWSARDNYGLRKRRRIHRESNDSSNSANLEMIRKCRARYGSQHVDLWCKACRRKKKCTRFTCNGEISERTLDSSSVIAGAIEDELDCEILSPKSPELIEITSTDDENSPKNCSNADIALSLDGSQTGDRDTVVPNIRAKKPRISSIKKEPVSRSLNNKG